MATKNLRLVEFLVACVFVSIGVTFAHARTWTTAELDTLSDREWTWADKKYKDPIAESSTEANHPEVLPERFQYSPAKYPDAAKKAGIEGSVWMKVLIDERGKVRAARVLEDSGLEVGFEEAAIDAAKKSIWKPAMTDGKRIPVWVKYEAIFSFRITADGEPIRQNKKWDWSVPSSDPSFDAEIELEKSETDPMPGPDEFIEVEEPPAMVKQGKLEYPEPARKNGDEGSVWVKVLIDRDGSVRNAMVAKASTCECGFEESALYGAINSKWKPAKQSGSPIMLWVTYEIKFQLKR